YTMKDMSVTVKRSIELLGLCLLGALISLGKGIIMPVLMAFFLSIMLLPIYRFLRDKKIPDILSIILPILMIAIVLAGLIWFFSAQISILVQDFPQIKHNISVHLTALSDWINKITNFSTQQQVAFLNEQSTKLLNYAGNAASGAALSLTNTFIF